MTTSLDDLRKQRLLFLSVHVFTIVLFAAIAVIAGALSVAFVLSGNDWVKLAISGGAVVAASGGLIVLQLLLPRSQRSATARLAQVEMAYLAVEKSIEFWEDHLRSQRQSAGSVDAQQVERAVLSVTQTCERIVQMLLTEAETPGAAESGAEKARAVPSPASRF